MKKNLIIGIVSLVISTSTIAQNANRVSAFNYLRSGELDEAKKYIDLATENENTKSDVKTWYYRAQIYDAITMTKNDKYKTLDTEASDKATASWVKVKELDVKKNYTDESKNGLIQGYTKMYNSGVESYKNADYINAQSKLQKALDFKKNQFNEIDTVTKYYVALSAEKNGKYDDAKSIYKELIALKYGGARTFLDLENACIQSKDDAGAAEALKMGREAFPNDKNLILEEMYAAIRNGKTKDAINNVKLAIEKEPTNANLYYILGTLYYNIANPTDKSVKTTDVEKKDYSTQSITNLKKAAELSNNNFDIQYQLGVIYYNEAVALNAAANNIKDQKKYDIEIKKADAKFNEALPYFEKAKTIGTTDANDKKSLLNNMKQLYLIIGNTSKVKEIEQEVKNL